jgi:hypothetical protein
MSLMPLSTPISDRVMLPLLSVSRASNKSPASAADNFSKSAAATTYAKRKKGKEWQGMNGKNEKKSI